MPFKRLIKFFNPWVLGMLLTQSHSPAILSLKELKLKMQKKQPVRIICFGNSITYGFTLEGQDTLPYPESLEKRLQKRYSNKKIQVINEGHNGWRTDHALKNVQELVLIKKPDLVILKFGINDAYSNFSGSYYKKQLTTLIQKIKSQNVQVILMTPTPITTPQAERLTHYRQIIKQVATEQKIYFLDLHQKILSKLKKTNTSLDDVLSDKVHFKKSYYQWIGDIVFEFIEKS